LVLVTLLISIVLGIIPLAGIAWILAAGSITTVDGMFMSLILLTVSGVFFLNAFWEARERDLLAFLHKSKAAASPGAPAVTGKAVPAKPSPALKPEE
jgi:uncharacterized membrane protein